MNPHRSPAFIVANTALLWLTTGIAAAAMWPIYQDSRFLILVAVTVVLGSAIAILGAVFRWRSWVTLLASVAVLLITGVPLAVPELATGGLLPSVEGLQVLVSSIALGWKQLLTITLPVGSYQGLLVPALVLVLASTVTGLSVALRARFGELGAIAPVALFLIGIAFGPETASRPVELALGMLASVLLWVGWRRWRRRRASIRRLAERAPGNIDPSRTAGEGLPGPRTLLAGTVILAVAALASVGAAAVVPPTSDRTVLRSAVAQPFDPRDYPSPLSAFRKYLRPENADQVMMTATGLPSGALIRIATLDSYDGVVYAVGSATVDSASGTFVRIPTAVDQSGVDGKQATVDVTIDGYSGVWIPTVGQLERVKFHGPGSADLTDSFAYNDTSGTAATVDGLGHGDSYQLTAVVPTAAASSELATLTPGAQRVPKLEVVPDGLSIALDQYTNGIQGPGKRLQAALAGLARDGYISHGLSADEPASRSGHSADRISELFTAPRMIGDAEQYAVAAAIMARQLGFPARVVVGFVPRTGSDALLGSDISAWIEVGTAQEGWVSVNPVPPLRPIPEEQPQDPTKISRPESIVPPPPDKSDPREDQTTPDTTADDPATLDPALEIFLAVARVTGWVMLIAAILSAPFIIIIAAKARRRSLRRGSGSTIQRIRGGWDEFRDSVVDHGLQPATAATRTEVAAVVGTLPSRVLAAVVDRAVFAPGDPDRADADRVWIAVGELRSALDAGLTRRARWRARISVRSLGGTNLRRRRRKGGS